MEKHTQEAKYKGKNKGRNGIASGFGYATKLGKIDGKTSEIKQINAM